MPDSFSHPDDDVFQAVSGVCSRLGVSGVFQLIRSSANTVYRCGDFLVKAYRASDSIPRMRESALTACLCADSGALMVAPCFDGELFLSDDSRFVVGFWPYVSSLRAPSWADLGLVLRRLHDVGKDLADPASPASASVPLWPGVIGSRWATEPYRLEPVAVPAAADLLDEAAFRLAEECAQTMLGLSPSSLTVVHGDATLENMLVGGTGPVLVDTDWMALAPPEIDLADVVFAYRTGAVDDRSFHRFLKAYSAGSSVVLEEFPLLELAVKVREYHCLVYRLAEAVREQTSVAWVPEAAAVWARTF